MVTVAKAKKVRRLITLYFIEVLKEITVILPEIYNQIKLPTQANVNKCSFNKIRSTVYVGFWWNVQHCLENEDCQLKFLLRMKESFVVPWCRKFLWQKMKGNENWIPRGWTDPRTCSSFFKASSAAQGGYR